MCLTASVCPGLLGDPSVKWWTNSTAGSCPSWEASIFSSTVFFINRFRHMACRGKKVPVLSRQTVTARTPYTLISGRDSAFFLTIKPQIFLISAEETIRRPHGINK